MNRFYKFRGYSDHSESTEALEMAQDGMVTVALDMALDDNLRAEGFAREINRVQSMRKNEILI